MPIQITTVVIPARAEFTKSIIAKGTKCWRLLHDGKCVDQLYESDAALNTPKQLFAGTKEECLDEIKRLGLTMPEGFLDKVEARQAARVAAAELKA